MNGLSRLITSASVLAVAIAVVVSPLARRDETARHMSRLEAPAEYARWRNLALRDEYGRIAADGLMRAKAQADLLRESQPDAPSDAGITRASWTSLGPGNVGGRLRAIVIHPTITERMFVAGVAGGIWRSNDGGASWAPVNDFMANLAVSAMVMTPGAPDVMYAASGEGFHNGDAIRGAGIFKSTDGGVTWTQLPSTSTAPSAGLSAEDFHEMTELAISPDARTLLATSTRGIFRSVDGGATFTRTTMAGGGTLDIGRGLVDVHFSPLASSHAVAGTYIGTALYSTDGGATWTLASGLPGPPPAGTFPVYRRVELAYAPTNPTIVYAGVDVDQGSLYKSIDGGRTFSEILDGATDSVNPYFSQGWYDNLLWVSPVDENFLVWGGLGLHRSTDGGLTFRAISSTGVNPLSNPTSPHVDQHVAVAHPGFNGTTNRIVYIGNDGGLYRAADIATAGSDGALRAGWSELNNGLGVTQFYGAAGHPGTGRVIGGTQDNGTPFFDPANANAGESWIDIFPGWDGTFAAFDPTDANVMYGATQNLQIFRSSGAPATASGRFIASRTSNNGLLDAGEAGRAPFVSPFILDPHDANTLIAGATSVWRTRNAKADPPSFEEIRSGENVTITAVAAARTAGAGRSNVIWIANEVRNGTPDYAIHRTTAAATDDAAAVRSSWTRVGRGMLPGRRILRITLQSDNPNVAYVTFAGFSPNNIWKTGDGGATWSAASGEGAFALPDAPVRDLEIHPTNRSWIYAATEVGLFTSEDAGLTWRSPPDGPANVSVDELFFLGTNLHAVTHGRGIFRTATNNPVTRPRIGAIANVSTPAGQPVSTSFSVSDPDTPLGNLTLSATSSNPSLLPINAIAFGGANADRTVTLTPAAGQMGVAVVTVTVSDGLESDAGSFVLGIQGQSPALSVIGNIITPGGFTLMSTSFTVSDPDTPLSQLILTGSSSNTTLLPNSGITFTGTDATRTVRLAPNSNQTGSSTITVTVSDGASTASRTFRLTILGSTSAPTISDIPAQTVAIGTTVTASFTVGDRDTPLTALTLTAASSNPTLVPVSGIAFGGSGASRTVSVTPAAGQLGVSLITVTVSDGSEQASTSFLVTVTSSLPQVGAPTNFAVTSNAGNQVSFSWTPGAGQLPTTGYVLEGGLTPGSVSGSLPVPAAGSTFSATLPTGAFYLRLLAVSGALRSAASNELRIFVNVPAPPSAPANLLGLVSGSSLALAWVNTATGGTPASLMLDVTGSLTTSLPLPVSEVFAFDGVPPGTYTFSLRAMNASGTSPPSNPVTLTFPGACAGAPQMPAGFAAVKNGASIAVSWSLPASGPAPTGYVLAVSGAFNGNLPTTARALSGTVAPGSYTLSVRATNACGSSAPTAAQTIIIP